MQEPAGESRISLASARKLNAPGTSSFLLVPSSGDGDDDVDGARRTNLLWNIAMLLAPGHCPLLAHHPSALLHVCLVSEHDKGKVLWVPR